MISRAFKQPSQVFFFAGFCFIKGLAARKVNHGSSSLLKTGVFTDPSQKKKNNACKIEFPMQGWLFFVFCSVIGISQKFVFTFQGLVGIHPLNIYNKSM